MHRPRAFAPAAGAAVPGGSRHSRQTFAFRDFGSAPSARRSARAVSFAPVPADTVRPPFALGVAAHCDGCIGFHAKALVALGANRAELEETLAVAIYMGGGPSLMYSAGALTAFEQFQQAANRVA